MVRYSTAGGIQYGLLIGCSAGVIRQKAPSAVSSDPATGKCRRGMRPAPNGIFGGPVGRKYSIGAMPSRWMDRAAVGLGRWQHSTRRIGLRGQRCGDLDLADAMVLGGYMLLCCAA